MGPSQSHGTLLSSLLSFCVQSRRLAVVVEASKGKQRMRTGGPSSQSMGPGQIPVPPVDPDNAEFVIFVRSKKLPSWAPLTIIKGGTAANMMVKSQESEMGRKMYGDTIVKNLAEALYKDYGAIVGQVKRQYPMLKAAKELEFGFKIRDKEAPAEWYMPKDIKVFPSRDELAAMPDNPVEAVGKGIKKLGDMFKTQ